jgi:putative permease
VARPMELIRSWFLRHFSDPQVVILTLLLLGLLLGIVLIGRILAPLVAAVIIAYMLEELVRRLRGTGLPQLPSVLLVFLGFLTVFLAALFLLLPLLLQQVTQLVQQVPTMLSEAQRILSALPEEYPQLFSEQQIEQFMDTLRAEVVNMTQWVVSYSVSSLVLVAEMLVYAILVPFLVFFLIKDKDRIVRWLQRFLPRERHLSTRVWREVDKQIGNYVRGKFWEIIIVWAITYSVFLFLGLQYAMLLAALTGLSVVVPYFGAAVVTIPVAAVAYFQFGLQAEFYYTVGAYAAIQFFDGNVLAPLLLSDAVNLHPVAIVASILFFGGIWGFWGVFFAVPLATVVQAVLQAWPTAPPELEEEPEPVERAAE